MTFYSTPTGELISEDLITDILLRLPVKSLLRFKSVSKPWLELISSRYFIFSHLKRSITASGADQTLIVFRRDDKTISLLHLNSDLTVVPLGLPYSISDFSFDPHFTIVGSHNGVVCVSVSNCPKEIAVGYDLIDYGSYEIENRNIYLWNPATRQSELIRPHNICSNLKSVCIGFGFDPIGDEYKVVRLVSLWNSPLFCAEVYSTKVNVWRVVETGPYDYPEYEVFDVCVNGFLCCTVLDGMMVFDLDKEVFSTAVKLPVINSDARITNFSGSIAVISSKQKKFKHKIQLWTLDDETCLRDDGVDASWTLMLNIRVDFPLWGVYGHFGSGELMLNAEDGIWILYNSEKKVSREIPLSISDMRQIFEYSESMVSFTGFEPVNRG